MEEGTEKKLYHLRSVEVPNSAMATKPRVALRDLTQHATAVMAAMHHVSGVHEGTSAFKRGLRHVEAQ
ncbi:hypothetical protein H5410_052505 [Solanum commersonii]|uniref:Uncharacterized protein n=1 Tax=Solanum commersonii TaxID=4109 RepID=A0A9J5X3T5_SOLCO|nr:hypothetical protein H5410_052505 [Solanum commersonii]